MAVVCHAQTWARVVVVEGVVGAQCDVQTRMQKMGKVVEPTGSQRAMKLHMEMTCLVEWESTTRGMVGNEEETVEIMSMCVRVISAEPLSEVSERASSWMVNHGLK